MMQKIIPSKYIKKISTLTLIMMLATISYNQNTFNYTGSLFLSNNTPINFKLELVEKEGRVQGYSITNIGLDDETKSEITGLYFKSDKSFQLQETQILSTRSEAPLNTFCYINMTLFLRGNFKNKRLEGTFKGNFLDSIKCAEGKIILIEDKKLMKIQKKIKKKIQKENLDTNQILETLVLKDGDDFLINWENNKLKLYIWDANKEDGDRIQLKINNKIVLNNYETKNKRKRIKYKLKNGENTIEITALNEGKSPPNSSRVELIDKNKKYPILSQLEFGRSAIIKVIKK